jgi:hypothetical protein
MGMRFRIFLALLGFHLTAGLSWSQPLLPQLFSESISIISLPRGAEIARVRQVNPDIALLTERISEIGKSSVTPQSITLNLFEDTQFIADLAHVNATSTGMAWIGRLRGVDFSQVTLVVSGNIVSGNIVSPSGSYHIRPVSEGVHEIQQIDTTLIRESQSDARVPDLPPMVGYDKDLTPSIAKDADNGATIDMMVVYTPDAVTGAGSLENLLSQIDLAVQETNQSFINSGVNPRIRLVHTEQANSYDEVSIIQALLDITGTTDGKLDTVHATRTAKGADLVSFWMEASSASSAECGEAWQMNTVNSAFGDYAFSVVKRSCATGAGMYGFAHQIGHNMGARHDNYVDSTTTPYTYAHGYSYWQGGWRTIMAMDNECQSKWVSCTRLPIWSNPTLTFGGVPMGNASTADNRRTLNETAATVARFKTTAHVVLASNQTTRNIDGAADAELLFKISVPSGARNLSISMSGGTGDADLYVRRGSSPTISAYDCSKTGLGNNHVCTFDTPEAGDYFIMIRGYAAFSGISLLASYPIALDNNTTIDQIQAPTGMGVLYKITVPSGAGRLTVSTSGGAGEADLYVRRSVLPTTSSFVCRRNADGNNHTCTINAPQAGDWYIMVYARGDFEDVALAANYPIELTNNSSVDNIGGTSGQELLYRTSIPAGTKRIAISLSGGDGDANLYVRHGSIPTTSTNDCQKNEQGNTHTCIFNVPAEGTYYIMIKGASAFSGGSLKAKHGGADIVPILMLLLD